MSSPKNSVTVVEKRGSPWLFAVLGVVLLAVGLYLGGWFDWITPQKVAQCQAQVRTTFPNKADQQILLPKCGNRHMVEGMAGGHANALTSKQILENLDAGKRVDIVSMLLGGAFIGGAIGAFAGAHRLRQNQRKSS